MSADNCIAILETTDKFKVVNKSMKKNMFKKGIRAWRVAHIQAVDNYDWYVKNEIHNLGCWLNDLFGGSEVFYDRDKAVTTAYQLDADTIYTEYGVVNIDASDYNFPGC